jgi:hypothetical protein
VHRYYLPSTTHGGGAGGFTYVPNPPPVNGCTFPANPNPESNTDTALEYDFIDFLMNGTPMPPNAYPTLAAGQLVPPTQKAEGFPNIPGYPFMGDRLNHPEKFDFGQGIDYFDQTGIITNQPPIVQRVLPEYVPPVNADGNETVGVPSVLLQAPLATYTGWNIYAAGPFKGQQCSLSASSYPFEETRTARLAAHDPRLSVEERYGTHAGYVCAVTTAANHAVAQRFLLAADAATLIAQAQAGNVLTDITPTGLDEVRARRLCSSNDN